MRDKASSVALTPQEKSAQRLRELLAQLASKITGFEKNSLRAGAIEKIIEETTKQGLGPEDLIVQAAEEHAELIERLNDAVPVGETYFFREPEHFQYLVQEILPSRRGALQILSAGCATGEEAYSLAACLEASRAGEGSEGLQVVGTDLSRRHLETARQGLYGSWSVRQSEDAIFPVFENPGHAPYRVRPELKKMTKFVQHNLLDPLAEGPFDVIFCRNVLVYFTPEAARRALKNLSAALRPGGILFLGPADVASTPLGFKLLGPSGHSIYQKAAPDHKKPPAAPASRAPRKNSKPPRPDLTRKKKPVIPAPAPRGEKDPIASHLRILEQMEKENDREAEAQLKQLCRQFPNYLPGLYESALWNARNKKKALAQELMGEIQKRLQSRDAKEIIPGPQDLTVDFYRISIRSFLKRAGD